MGDFAILDEASTLKTYQDQQADIMNGRLTAPIYYILKYGSADEKDTLININKNKKGRNFRDILQAANIVIDSGAYDFSFRLIKSYWRKAKNYLHENFEKSQERDNLSKMISIIRTNKYLHYLKSKEARKDLETFDLLTAECYGFENDEDEPDIDM